MRFVLVHPVRWLTLALIVVAVFLQVQMVKHFWESFGAGDEVGGRILVAIGIVLALIEVVLFPVADILEAEGNRWRAWIARVVFVFLASVTGFIDYGAFTRLSAADQSERERARVVYEQQQNIQTDAAARISELRAQLAERGLDRPSAALAAEREAQIARKERYEAIGQLPPASVTNAIARLESARITALEIERLAAASAAAAEYLATHAAESGVHPQFESIAAILQEWGVNIDAEQARINMAFAMMLAFKFVIMFGIWILLPRIDEMRQFFARSQGVNLFDAFGAAVADFASSRRSRQDDATIGTGDIGHDAAATGRPQPGGQGDFAPSNDRDDVSDEVSDMFKDLDRGG